MSVARAQTRAERQEGFVTYHPTPPAPSWAGFPHLPPRPPSRAPPLVYFSGGEERRRCQPRGPGLLTSASSPGDAPWPRKQKRKDAPACAWPARDPTPEAVRLCLLLLQCRPPALFYPGWRGRAGRAPSDRPSGAPTCSRGRRRRSSSCRSCSCLTVSNSRSWALRKRSNSPVRCPRSSARCFLSCTDGGAAGGKPQPPLPPLKPQPTLQPWVSAIRDPNRPLRPALGEEQESTEDGEVPTPGSLHPGSLLLKQCWSDVLRNPWVEAGLSHHPCTYRLRSLREERSLLNSHSSSARAELVWEGSQLHFTTMGRYFCPGAKSLGYRFQLLEE